MKNNDALVIFPEPRHDGCYAAKQLDASGSWRWFWMPKHQAETILASLEKNNLKKVLHSE